MQLIFWLNGWLVRILCVVAVIVIAVMAIGGLASNLCSAQTAPGASPSQTNSAAATPPAAPGDITGAELYSIHCNRCHQERYPTERTGAQWKTIMLHMQVRANIPASQARLILQYLQENSGR